MALAFAVAVALAFAVRLPKAAEAAAVVEPSIATLVDGMVETSTLGCSSLVTAEDGHRSRVLVYHLEDPHRDPKSCSASVCTRPSDILSALEGQLTFVGLSPCNSSSAEEYSCRCQ